MNTLSCTLLVAYTIIKVETFTLQTTFSSDGVGYSGGNMFDVENIGTWKAVIEQFDVNIWKPPSDSSMTVSIYTKYGSYSGHETNSASWTQIHSQVFTSPRNAGATTSLTPLSAPVTINVNTIRSFFIHCTSTIWSTEGHFGPGFLIAEDGNLAVYEGILVSGIFSGTVRNQDPAYIWNGNIHYSIMTPAPSTYKPTTKNPTISPSTAQPTKDPTKDPTSDPTCDPTIDPTFEPTSHPTTHPTYDPTMEPTTKRPTDSPSVVLQGQVIEFTTTIQAESTQDVGQLSTGGPDYYWGGIDYMQLVTFGVAAVLILILIASLIFARCYEKNDFYDKMSFIMFIAQVLDTLYDIMFCLELKNGKLYGLMISCTIFIVFPVMFSYFQLLFEIKRKWMKIGKNELRQWLTHYVFVLYFVSIISGSSFNAIKLCKSNLFGLKIFDIPLTKAEVVEFQTKRVFSIIIFENLPQLSLQCIYLFIFASIAGTSNVVFISMGFSLMSIIIAITSSIQQKKIIKSQDRIEISFDVTSMDIAEMKYARNCVNGLKQRISGKLGINSDLFEISKPTLLPNNGLHVTVMIYINQKLAVHNNYQTLINTANSNGEIGEFVKDSWKLSKIPIILNLSYQQIMSQNTVNLKTISVRSLVVDTDETGIISGEQCEENNIQMSIMNSDFPLANAPLVIPVTSGQDSDDEESIENTQEIITPTAKYQD